MSNSDRIAFTNGSRLEASTGGPAAGEIGLAKLRGVLRRRKLALVATITGVIGVAAALMWQVPPVYKAQAVIRVLEAQPSKEYVAPTVAEQIGERLKSLRLGVMARPLIAEAVQALDLQRAFPRLSLDEVIDQLRDRMDVKVEGEDTFLLLYTDSNPERARALVNQVASRFMKQQVDRRQQIASATVEALQADVAALKPDLDQSMEAVRDYKLKHYGALPEQQESNLRTLDETTMEINIQSTNLDTALERRRQLLATALSPLRHHEDQLATQLYEARTKYTEDNPEVQKVRAQYEKVRGERIAEERDLSQRLRNSNPELVGLEGEIARSRAILAALRARQSDVRRRVEATAKNGQELAAIQLQYEGVRDKYHATQGRLRDAELALQLERNLAGQRFDLVEGASLPTHASTPDRTLMAGGALLLALLLGLGVAFALDATDTTVRTASDLAALGEVPPLWGAVPRINPKGKSDNAEA
jgi:uncharacterized protein involved in exopolysaccharide biosynthesis